MTRHLVLTCLVLTTAPAAQAETQSDYPVQPVPFTAVRVQDSFWSPRFETNRTTTVRYDFQKCEETGRIDNFAKAGRLMPGPFRGTPFDDSDVFKVIEGAAYTLALHPDPELAKYLDDLIAKIAAAQEPDGYLYSARTIDPKCRVDFFGPQRWSNLAVSHELYNVGHMYEAAVAHFQATGKKSLLNVALKNADLICKTFGPGADQLKEPPGHQEIEIGLVKLYRATGERKYLDQAKFFLDTRGRAEGHRLRGAGQQDHKPVLEQDQAVGHAVRAGYMYAGMTDVAALTGAAEFVAAVDRLWQDVVTQKLYLTGGIGAQHGGEAFGEGYELPNASAYNETCAAIANALWNHRLFLLHGDAGYVDVLERIIYNGFLSGISMSGDRFFYPNPLENGGRYERSPWFGCSCCPVNVVRFIPSIAGYIYASRGDALYVNLFVGGAAQAQVAGTTVELKQQTRYPWDGKVAITVNPKSAAEFTLHVRVPGWARNRPVPSDLYRYDDGLEPQVQLAVNGQAVELKLDKGFATIRRQWQAGDTVTLDLPMPVRRVAAHESVKADRGRFAVERGPLVYCAEGADNEDRVLDKVPGPKVRFETQEAPDLLGGVVTIRIVPEGAGDALTCIPYYAWCHRGQNEMTVWFPTRPDDRLASHCWGLDSVEACFDGREPKDSNDHSIPRFTWWDHRGSVEWVERRFEQPTPVGAVQVYWFDDTGRGSCRVPQSWRLLYQDGKEWKPVAGAAAYGTQRDRYNRVTFTPVTTSALRLEVQLQPDFSGGILEWKTE
jgi:uncharacterized protein